MNSILRDAYDAAEKHDLPVNVAAVLIYLAADADPARVSMPSQRSIAAGTRVGLRTVARFLIALERDGLIRRAGLGPRSVVMWEVVPISHLTLVPPVAVVDADPVLDREVAA